MNLWLRLLVAWYARKCDKYEGQLPQTILLKPAKFELKGKNWEGKELKITVETVKSGVA